MATPTAIAGYVALFVATGFLFLFVNLLVGKFLRPDDPHEEKLEVYECGEPTIGSSFVQFDLRFYVVALVFIVFDVEVAFLFPLATVQGKAANLASERLAVVEENDAGQPILTADAVALQRELGVPNASIQNVSTSVDEGNDTAMAIAAQLQDDARRLAVLTFAAINAFFFVLLVGFAYEWKTGAFDWVRAVTRERREAGRPVPAGVAIEEEPALSA